MSGTVTTYKSPINLGGVEAPRTPGLGKSASMPELVRDGAVPGAPGILLSDDASNPAALYGGMFKLTQQNRIEYALTREAGALVLRSGALNKVAVPRDADLIAHTHPFDPGAALPQPMPSRADVNALNRRWSRNPGSPRPVSDIVWGPGPDDVTTYGATGLDDIPDPTKGGLKPRRTW